MTMLAAESLEVPLPGSGQRLVEVVCIEHKGAFGGPKEAEVGQVGVPTRLHQDVGSGGLGKVECHHSRSAAVVGERRLTHSLMSQRDQIR